MIFQFTVTFPDGRPAANEPLKVCAGSACRNISTDEAGVVHFSAPPHLHHESLLVSSVNYPERHLENSNRAYMYKSQTSAYAVRYFSPSNSSLLINPEQHHLDCSPGGDIALQLPVMYAATNTSEATIFVQ
ncbi:hypothetical protein FHG87_025578, partial [Trinorchestia longiramus]